MTEEASIEQLDMNWVEEVLVFWFKELSVKDWFVKSQAVDASISDRFYDLYKHLSQSVSQECRASAQASLAAIIVLDQFPRNMFRNSSQAFSTDHLALELAQAAISRGFDKNLPNGQRQFIYMPFEHSEDDRMQERSIELFTALGNEHNLKFAIVHKDIIDQFGRFPHRNDALGRDSSPEEIEFLTQPGSSF